MVQATKTSESDLEAGVLALFKAARSAQVLATGDPLDMGMSKILITVARTGPMRPSAVAQQNHIDVSTASRHIDALARQGLVDKATDPVDARACLVEVTGQGREVMKAMVTNRARAVAPALSAWSPGDREQLLSLLVRLAHDLDDLISEETSR